MSSRGSVRGGTSPLRLLVVITTSDFGGTESFLERLVGGLDRSVIEPVVCSLCPPGRVGRRLQESGFPLIDLGMSPRARPFELIRGAFRLAREIDRRGIDVVQGLLYRGNVVGAVASRLARRRPRMVAGQRSLTPMTGRSAALAARLTRGLTHRTVAVSTAVKNYLIVAEGAPGEGIVVIGNGVDTNVFRPGDRESARRALGLDPGAVEGKVVLGAVGRLVPEKGLPFLFSALATLQASGRKIRTVLVGGGPDREALTEQSRTLGIEVDFLGVRRDLHELYPGFDIFCLPSLEEGSPQVLLEAMACGCASVASSVGGVPEVVTGPSLGRLVPPGDDESLTMALRQLVDDPVARRDMGLAAREHVVERFDLAQGIRAHERLYLELADS